MTLSFVCLALLNYLARNKKFSSDEPFYTGIVGLHVVPKESLEEAPIVYRKYFTTCTFL